MLQTVGKTDVLPSQVLVDLCEEREEALVPAPFSSGNRTPRPLINPSLGPALPPTLHAPPTLPPPIAQSHSQPTHMTPVASHQSYSPTQSHSSILPSRKVSDQISSPPSHSAYPRRRQSSSHAQALSIALNVAQNERMRNAHEEHLMYQHPQSHTKPLGSAFWEAENLVSDESTRSDLSSSIPRRASSGANVGPAWLSRVHERKYAPKHHLKATIPNVSGPYADSTTHGEFGWPPVPIPAPLRHSPRLANAALHSRASSSAAAVAAAATTANSVNASPSQLMQKQMAANNTNELKMRVPTFVTNGAGQQIKITPSTFTQPSESGTPTNSPPLSTTSTLSAPVTSTAQPSRNAEDKEQPLGLGLGFPSFPQSQRYTFGQNTFVAPSAPESLTTSALTLAGDVRVPPPRMSARRWLRLQKQAAARNAPQSHQDSAATTSTAPRKIPSRSRSVPSTPRVSAKTPRIPSREFEKSVSGGRTYSRIIPNATLPLLNSRSGDASNVSEDTPPFKPNLTTGLDEGFPALSSSSAAASNQNTQFRGSSSLTNLYSASLVASRKQQQQQQQQQASLPAPAPLSKEKRRSASVGSEGSKGKGGSTSSSKKKGSKENKTQHQRKHSSQSSK